jgi:hypothetical protein
MIGNLDKINNLLLKIDEKAKKLKCNRDAAIKKETREPLFLSIRGIAKRP